MCLLVSVCAPLHLRMFLYAWVYMCVYMHTQADVQTQVCVCIYMLFCACLYACSCLYAIFPLSSVILLCKKESVSKYTSILRFTASEMPKLVHEMYCLNAMKIKHEKTVIQMCVSWLIKLKVKDKQSMGFRKF